MKRISKIYDSQWNIFIKKELISCNVKDIWWTFRFSEIYVNKKLVPLELKRYQVISILSKTNYIV